MKKIFFLVMCFLILSCATNEKNTGLISSARFNKKKLNFIPYSFDNANKEFVKYEGDFLRIKYEDSLRMDMVCYSTNHGLILNIQSEDVDLEELKIRVVSKNNGVLIKNYYLNTKKNKGLLFFKDFKSTQEGQRIDLTRNDIIKIQINKKEYQFFSALKD